MAARRWQDFFDKSGAVVYCPPVDLCCLSFVSAGLPYAFVWMLALALVSQAPAQTNYYATNGTEYSVVGSLLGDQVFPDVAISPTNGMVVWQDNATDGDGWGVSARRLDGTLSGTLSTFRVNVIGGGDQENPRVTLLKNGGAAFVWQGGKEGFQHIFARFLTPANTFSHHQRRSGEHVHQSTSK